ncbi:MAG: hypothetical protein IH571_02085, partial [Acholeplasmataceae bacterium]|nr:hypothetical protein [Acholeplasmataceae bacterium]
GNDTELLLSLNESQFETVQEVSTQGALISIDDESSSIYGFEISIPSGAVDESISFGVSTQEIEKHNLGDIFDPITPLIHVDNGSVFTNKPMIINIPITLSEDEFAMGFYYDETTNKLEGIPLKDVTSTGITLLTNHFSSIVVSKIKIEDLLELNQAVDRYGDTGFAPGVDDWQFTNYGSYLAQNGHCAGQVLTMSWYYHTQKVEKNEPALHDLFDNVGYDATPEFFEDDQLGYRFASVIQYLLDFQSPEFYDYLSFAYGKESLIYYAFSYAMVVTKTPQLMAIYAHDDFGNITSGHAILAYKMSGYDIYVADPNYPGQTNRKVHFNTSPGVYKFDPYSSGANAQSIANDGALQYDEMYYIGESALIDYESIEDAYSDVLDGTIGDLFFPTLEAVYLDDYNEDVNLQSWKDIENESFTLGTTHNEKMSCSLQNKVVIAFTANHPNAIYTLYDGTEQIDGPYLAQPDGYVYFEIALNNGINEVGVYAEIQEQGELYYADFMRVRIDYNAGTTIPCEATIVGTYYFYSRSDGLNLVNNHKIEVRSDGTYTESYYRNDSSYHNESSGTWVVEPGQNAGENILYLTAQSITTTYEVLDNYQTLRYTSGDIVFIFKK